MIPARDLDSAPIIREQVLSCAVYICQRVWQTIISAVDNANETHELMIASSNGCMVRVWVVDGKSKDGERVKAIQMIILGLSQVGVMLRLNIGRHYFCLVFEGTRCWRSRCLRCGCWVESEKG